MKNLSRAIVGALFVSFLLVAATSTAMAQDPVQVAPDHYKVLLDNERVRVLEVTVKPGEKTPMHSHPANVIYSFGAAKAKFTLGGGRTQVRAFKTGDVVWGAAEKHSAVNTGTTDVHAVIFEMKGGKSGKTVSGADPVRVDPKHFKVRLNNAWVRVLEFTAKPGEKSPMHTHPDYVVYNFGGGKTKYTFPDGKTAEREATAGTAAWNQSEAHAADIGYEAHGLLVELKAPAAKPKK